jgi:hypothetical protein
MKFRRRGPTGFERVVSGKLVNEGFAPPRRPVLVEADRAGIDPGLDRFGD